MLGGLLQCCNSSHDVGGVAELRVFHLSSDIMDSPTSMHKPAHLLTRPDSFDLTTSPRGSLAGNSPALSKGLTLGQRTLRERIWLPKLRRCPALPGASPDDTEEAKREELLRCFQDFVVELHQGIHMTQITSNQEYSVIHCQVLDDLHTLKVDQGSGCIIEFPLSAVSKVYRIVKSEDKWYGHSTPAPPLPASSLEHIVVVEFMRRKLALVFHDVLIARRFLLCIELLIRRAQECKDNSDAFGHCLGGRDIGFSAAADPPTRGSFGTKAPGQRVGKPLLPMDVLSNDTKLPSKPRDMAPSLICACETPS